MKITLTLQVDIPTDGISELKDRYGLTTTAQVRKLVHERVIEQNNPENVPWLDELGATATVSMRAS
jgi:hypothetical protein